MTLAVVEKTLPMATITGRTDRRTDRVRRNMRPPREEGRIIKEEIKEINSSVASFHEFIDRYTRKVTAYTF